MDQSPPLVSVVVLCFNTGIYVVDALDSLFSNGYSNFEVYCIDDASSDGVSVGLLEEYFLDKENVRFFVNSENLGVIKNLNRALNEVSGEFLILLGDDILLPGKIAGDVKAFAESEPSTAVVFSIHQSIDEHGGLFPDFSPSIKYPDTIPRVPTRDEFLAAGGYVTAPTAMMRRSAIQNVGGWDERISWEDKQMWFTLFRAGYSFSFRAEITAYYRRRVGSLGSQFKKGDLVGQILCYLPDSDSKVARKEIRRVIFMAASAQLSGVHDLKECLDYYRKSNRYSRLLYILGKSGVLTVAVWIFKFILIKLK